MPLYFRSNDMFCFELVSMVTALTGSGVGRAYLAQQSGLLQDLFSLLHTASPRVQRQVGYQSLFDIPDKQFSKSQAAFCPAVLDIVQLFVHKPSTTFYHQK